MRRCVISIVIIVNWITNCESSGSGQQNHSHQHFPIKDNEREAYRYIKCHNKTCFIIPSYNLGCIKSQIGSIDLSESQSRMKIFDTNISMFGSNSLSPTTRVTSNQARREGHWTMAWTIPLLDMTWIWLGYDQLDCWKLPGSHEIITPDSHGVAQCLQTECWVPDQAADCGNCLCAMVWNLSHRQTYSFNCYAKLTK